MRRQFVNVGWVNAAAATLVCTRGAPRVTQRLSSKTCRVTRGAKVVAYNFGAGREPTAARRNSNFKRRHRDCGL